MNFQLQAKCEDLFLSSSLQERRSIFMKKQNISIRRRLGALAIALVMAVQLAACGDAESAGDLRQISEWVWVPEYVDVGDESVSYYEMKQVGDGLYYISYDWDEETQVSSQSLCKYSLTDGSVTKKPLMLEEVENGGQNVNSYTVAEDGSLYAVVYTYIYSESEEGQEYQEPERFLCKFDAEGKMVYKNSMAEQMKDGDNYVRYMAIDGEGRLYVATESSVWLYNGEGAYQGTIDMSAGAGGWIQAMGMGRDGKMYISYYSYDGSGSSNVLKELDYDNKKAGASYEGFVNGNGDALIPGIEKDFLVYDGTAVYEYDMATQTKEELFRWIESDINGNYVRSIGMTEDGRLVAVINDWEDEANSGIALLTKTSSDQVPQKETIVVATMDSAYNLQSLAVKFNKASDKYRVVVKEYVDYDSWDGNDYTALWSDALANLNNDITSSNCPDIIDISGLNIQQMASKGVFEDLNAYLEKSDKLSRSDFLENLLEAYTFDGVLVTIPQSFMMQTIVGKASEVGTEMGWTLEELMAYADANPGAALLEGATKASIMQMLMMYNEDRFINWTTGECSFDSDEFKELLAFVNRFPEEYDYDSDSASTATKIQRGELLLDGAYISDFNDVQIYPDMFGGDVTFIGYPTMDGSIGCAMSAYQSYAIASKSKMKEAAWEFIESCLLQEQGEFSSYGFPAVKSRLDAMAEEAVKVEYLTDENGEQVLDENGVAIKMGGSSSIHYEDGWSYTYREPTQEEVDLVYELMKVAKPVSYNYGDMVSNIITEEAEAFYKGQKSADEVAGIIQSRVKIYVEENN